MDDSTLITILLTIAVACALTQVIVILIGVIARITWAVEDWRDDKRRARP